MYRLRDLHPVLPHERDHHEDPHPDRGRTLMEPKITVEIYDLPVDTACFGGG